MQRFHSDVSADAWNVFVITGADSHHKNRKPRNTSTNAKWGVWMKGDLNLLDLFASIKETIENCEKRRPPFKK